MQNLGRVIVLCITLSVSRVIVEEFWPSFFFLQCSFRSLRSAGSPKISRQCFNEVEVWTLKLCRFTSATGTAIPHLLILSFHSSIQSQRRVCRCHQLSAEQISTDLHTSMGFGLAKEQCVKTFMESVFIVEQLH